MAKTFVLDTNVLLHNSDCIDSFADNTVVLPMEVIEELDKFKSESNELGRHARHVIRTLDALRSKGNFRNGVPLDPGGLLKIVSGKKLLDQTGLDNEITDNLILRVAYSLHKKGDTVIFVSKDINARVKADALGLKAVDFEKQKVNFDDLFSGFTEINVPVETIDNLYKHMQLKNCAIGNYPNEFLLLKDETDEKHSVIAHVLKAGNLKMLSVKHERVWNIRPRNKEQRVALELLMNPDIQLVTLIGQAGTGKTLLALASGLQQTLQEQTYDRILVSRPIVPLGRDIGFLPGDKKEKISHWMQPIFDNLSFLLRDEIAGASKSKKKKAATTQQKIQQLLDENAIELEALTYIRGRSIANQFVIIDEAQNLTPHEVKTIISRAGKDTKIVLTGDPYQIDSPYLDASSNGLTYAAERLKGQNLHGHITLKRSERSALAAVAAEFL